MTTTDTATVLLGAGCFCLGLDLIRLKRRVKQLETFIFTRRRRQP